MNQGEQEPAIIVEPLVEPFRKDQPATPTPQTVPVEPARQPERVPA